MSDADLKFCAKFGIAEDPAKINLAGAMGYEWDLIKSILSDTACSPWYLYLVCKSHGNNNFELLHQAIQPDWFPVTSGTTFVIDPVRWFGPLTRTHPSIPVPLASFIAERIEQTGARRVVTRGSPQCQIPVNWHVLLV
jgi:hypothetical protein